MCSSRTSNWYGQQLCDKVQPSSVLPGVRQHTEIVNGVKYWFCSRRCFHMHGYKSPLGYPRDISKNRNRSRTRSTNSKSPWSRTRSTNSNSPSNGADSADWRKPPTVQWANVDEKKSPTSNHAGVVHTLEREDYQKLLNAKGWWSSL